VVDLHSERPVWQVPPSTIAAIKKALGRQFQVVVVEAPAVSDGDGGSGSLEAIQAAWGAEIYIGYGVPEGVARAATGTLRWAHSAAAGVGSTLTPAFLATGAKLTNSRGIHAEPMAEWVIAAVAMCLRGLLWAVAGQREGRWLKGAVTDRSLPVRELSRARMGIVGLGGIGSEIARRAAALGMEVRAVRRHPDKRCPRGVLWVGGPGSLEKLARMSDVLVIAAPETSETRGLVGASVLSALPRGAFVINVARGSLLDESALLEHLASGQVGGCVLDVFSEEPLPEGHPFWDHPRVVVSPHISAVSDRFWDRQTALLVENIRRYRRGARLLNLVDLKAGY
jgi:phosphoglycerate dehydrogenase-like enzyme